MPSQCLPGLTAPDEPTVHKQISNERTGAVQYKLSAMPTSFKFLVFSDLPGMHDAIVRTQIRKHAMKDIGVSRRRASRKLSKVELEIRHPVTSPDAVTDSTPRQHGHQHLFLDDRALYEPHIRALSCSPDPFNSASTPIDSSAHGLLQYFRHYSTQFPNNFTFTPNIAKVFDSAVQDELMMHCILSAAASRLHYMQGTLPSHLAEKAFHSTQQSLRLLQIRLHGDLPATASSVEPLVDCILYLAAAALYRGDEASAEIHVKAAVRVIEVNGGLGVLKDPRVLIRMLGLDDILACRRLRSCSFACTYDPGLLLPSTEDDFRGDPRATDPLADGHSLLTETTLPKTLRDLIPQIVECDRLKDTLVPANDGTSSRGLLHSHRQRLRSLAIRNRLLAFTGIDPKSRSFRAVLIIWTLLPPNDPRQAKNAGVVARHLIHMLSDNLANGWGEGEEVGLWCLLVGVFGAFIGGGDFGWYVKRIHEVLISKGKQLGLDLGRGLLESLVGLQKRFLWREGVTRPLTMRLVELLNSRCQIDEGGAV
jgi:hypothetical protein